MNEDTSPNEIAIPELEIFTTISQDMNFMHIEGDGCQEEDLANFTRLQYPLRLAYACTINNYT
ncbi:Ground-like domain-containing protein [Caenorhabditis elegans]|uniref:Ground-like domain-containing protein n=1 Tax=Caenorhabditis elegans TaxID=6239 RepID=Q8MNW0_CAEEL|nr:Ground-like domain-containing protein [Caenorhabditis elegans]CCD67211.1 Ground-like domain-containing protein [Caenorhabditis elegans]|eukprot:NP_741108.1 Uncharacterized protein CELE_C44B11.6 [Caenorhabditis elegans]